MKKEYIITENTERYGFCLLFTLGKRTEEEANKALEKARLENPNKELRLEEVEEKDAWWNQGWLD